MPLIVGAGALLLAFQQQPGAAKEQPPDLVVVARLRDVGSQNPPSCGGFHFGVAMKYTVVRVVAGKHEQDLLYAVHGCPEMTRRVYGGPAAGDLTAFRVGELHRLALRRDIPYGVALVDSFRETEARRYWVVRADAAAEPSPPD